MEVPFCNYSHGKEARDKMLLGVKTLHDSVVCTLGARGRNVVIESPIFARPIVTNDGVTIVRSANLKDPVENQGMQIVKQASIRSNDVAGDGTTTAVVLAYELVRAVFEKLNDNKVNAVKLKRDIEEYVKLVLEEVKNGSLPVDNVKKLQEIARVSCQDAALGDLIGGVMYELGLDGAMMIEEHNKNGVVCERARGYKWKQPIKHGIWNNVVEGECKMTGDVKVLILNDAIADHHKQFLPFVQKFSSVKGLDEQGKPVYEVHVDKLVIVSEDVNANSLRTLFQNGQMGHIQFLWIQPPSFGETRKEWLKDLAAYTGARLLDSKEGGFLKNMKLEDLGTVAGVVANKDHTIFIPNEEKNETSAMNATLDRINSLRELLNVESDEVNAKSLEHRISTLTGSIAVIKYGANTDVERKELKYRVEDAVHATKAALQEGIVAGGGVALLNAGRVLKGKDDMAAEIVTQMTKAPMRAILNNAGVEDVDGILDRLNENTSVGIDVFTEEEVNMIEAGIVDPQKVLRCAVENALSAAGALMLTECSIVNELREDEQSGKKV